MHLDRTWRESTARHVLPRRESISSKCIYLVLSIIRLCFSRPIAPVTLRRSDSVTYERASDVRLSKTRRYRYSRNLRVYSPSSASAGTKSEIKGGENSGGTTRSICPRCRYNPNIAELSLTRAPLNARLNGILCILSCLHSSVPSSSSSSSSRILQEAEFRGIIRNARSIEARFNHVSQLCSQDSRLRTGIL